MSYKTFLRPGKEWAADVIERFWCTALSTAGGLARQPVVPWTSPGGQRVLVVAPHPDDEAAGCVGVILRHIRSGDDVCIAIATDGRLSKALPDPDSMAEQRRQEAETAARMMNVDRVEWIGLAEGSWREAELRDNLVVLLASVEPDIIYAPSRIDFHPEHRRVAHALALALTERALQSAEPQPLGRPAGKPAAVRIYQVQVPLNPFLTNLIVDISSVIPESRAVLRAYASQWTSLRRIERLRRYNAAAHLMTGEAEEFWELSAQSYAALHVEVPTAWPEVFRGLRDFPLSDPLAYFAGLRERRGIAKAARERR